MNKNNIWNLIIDFVNHFKEIISKSVNNYRKTVQEQRYDHIATINDQLTIVLWCSEILSWKKHSRKEKIWAIRNINKSVKKVADNLDNYFELPEVK